MIAGFKKLFVLDINGCPKISTVAIELFRLSRGVLMKEDELLTIGPNWQFWWYQRIFLE